MNLYRHFLFGLIITCLVVPAFSQTVIQPVNRLDVDAFSLDLYNALLYVCGGNQVRIYDISSGSNPQQVGSIQASHAAIGVAVVNNFAIVALDAQNDPNILVLDISDLGAPQLLFERRGGEFGRTLTTIASVGPYVYLGVDGEGIVVVELTQTGEPVIVGGLPADSTVTDIATLGTRAYVSTWYAVLILDISDPAAPSLIATEFSNDFNNGLSVEGNYLAVAEGIEGITLYDISNPDSLNKLTTLYSYGENEANQVYIRQNYAYAAMLYRSSQNVFDPGSEGGLRIYDFERIGSAREIQRNNIEKHAFDVIAYNGYVYVAEDSTLGIFRHGPLGERPTSTPIVPTSTPTYTFTPTPTNTPPFLATATRRPIPPTNTPVPVPPTNTPFVPPPPTNTPPIILPTPTYTPTPQEQPQPTSVPEIPTNTPVSSTGLTPYFVSDFDGPLLMNEQFAAQPPFSGNFTLATHVIDFIPTDGAFAGATNGRGLKVVVNPGEAATFLGPFLSLDNALAFVRVNVRSTGQGAIVTLALLDGSFNGSLVQTSVIGSSAFADAYKRLATIYKPPTGAVIPIIQVASDGSVTGAVTLYFDNFELFSLPSGTCLPVDMLGMDGTAP